MTDDGSLTSLQFAAAVRTLGNAARHEGLAVPGYRSPPKDPAADRSLRQTTDGSWVVAVRVRGRPHGSVLFDLLDGLAHANGLPLADPRLARVRDEVLAPLIWPGG